MRDLVVSLLIVVVLISSWLFFDAYAKEMTIKMSETITTVIVPSAEAENWDDCIKMINKTESRWTSFKRTAHLFLGADDLYDIDDAFARSLEFAQAFDVSNNSGELSSLANQLMLLNSQEKITWGNIF